LKKKWILYGLIGLLLTAVIATGYVLYGPEPLPPAAHPVTGPPPGPPVRPVSDPAQKQPDRLKNPETVQAVTQEEQVVSLENTPTTQARPSRNITDPPVTDDSLKDLTAAKHAMFEVQARSSLPLLSVMSHNPYWEKDETRQYAESAPSEDGRYTYTSSGGRSDGSENLEMATGGENTAPSDSDSSDKALAVELDEDGEFGRIGPPDGHVWIRIQAEHSNQYKEIMAQTADLYRAETGYSDTVTVMLWVGGRPYARHSYEQ